MTEDIGEKYSESSWRSSDVVKSRLFAVDSGSPVSSVALAWDDVLVTREFPAGDVSKRLLTQLDEMLDEVGGRLGQLDGLLALRGPGSFTGLRVGLATLLGLHQALGIPAAAVTTFEALARQARRRDATSRLRIFATVDALRGERFVQGFEAESMEPLGDPAIRSDAQIGTLKNSCVIGFGLTPLRALVPGDADRRAGEAESITILHAEPLACDLLAIGARPGFVWKASRLTEPLYLRPPAAAV